MDIFHLDKLSLFLLFFVPGFISIKVWGYLVPSQSKKMNEYFFDAVSYSCLNFAILSWLIIIIGKENYQNEHPIVFYFLTLLILLIFPILWPIIFKGILSTKFFQRFTINVDPTGWDHHFKKGEQQYVLVHLINGKLIGGVWGFSSSFPNPEDLYLTETWKVSPEGEFMHPIDESKGMWIGKDNISYLEFFKAQTYQEEKEEEEK
ncbi:DUF6338 family protein [Alkalihalobacillus sp. TS-13]|uniref:DUF6338 family protein n=1 Tax=Alkalihalobacillus sp. TS-13 TaxID=2842455 RepID=UPI001C871607|nr:DUF6338 family protein [Alkalihalobacillus sp. TS-13]